MITRSPNRKHEYVIALNRHFSQGCALIKFGGPHTSKRVVKNQEKSLCPSCRVLNKKDKITFGEKNKTNYSAEIVVWFPFSRYISSALHKNHGLSQLWTEIFHDNLTLPKSTEKCWLEWDFNSHLRDTGPPLYLLGYPYPEGASLNPAPVSIFLLISAVSDYHEKFLFMYPWGWFWKSSQLRFGRNHLDKWLHSQVLFFCTSCRSM